MFGRRARHTFLDGKPGRKRSFRRHWPRRQSNIKIYLQEGGYENVD